MAEEEIDIVALRASLKSEAEYEWKMASQSTNILIQKEYQKNLELIKSENITVEQFIERVVEHKLNDVLNPESEEE